MRAGSEPKNRSVASVDAQVGHAGRRPGVMAPTSPLCDQSGGAHGAAGLGPDRGQRRERPQPAPGLLSRGWIENRIAEPGLRVGEQRQKAARQAPTRAAWLKIGPTDLNGIHRYRARLDPDTPSNRVIETRALIEQMNARLISYEDAVTEAGSNPDEVELSWYTQDIKKSPEMAALVKQMTLQKIGTIVAGRLEASGVSMADLLGGGGAGTPPGCPRRTSTRRGRRLQTRCPCLGRGCRSLHPRRVVADQPCLPEASRSPQAPRPARRTCQVRQRTTCRCRGRPDGSQRQPARPGGRQPGGLGRRHEHQDRRGHQGRPVGARRGPAIRAPCRARSHRRAGRRPNPRSACARSSDWCGGPRPVAQRLAAHPEACRRSSASIPMPTDRKCRGSEPTRAHQPPEVQVLAPSGPDCADGQTPSHPRHDLNPAGQEGARISGPAVRPERQHRDGAAAVAVLVARTRWRPAPPPEGSGIAPALTPAMRLL